MTFPCWTCRQDKLPDTLYIHFHTYAQYTCVDAQLYTYLTSQPNEKVSELYQRVRILIILHI